MLNSQKKISDIDIRDAFFDELYDIAKNDRDVVFLTADMSAFSLERFKKDLSRQYINVGVSEQNMISIAAGLALSGKTVFIYAIAPFVTMRCYEQIKVDISGMCLPVTIIGAGPGLTYSSDGPTHHSIQDISIMRALPEMTIINPADSITASAAARISYKSSNPVYVRIDKGKLPQLYSEGNDFSDGLSLLKKGRDLLIISTGVMVHQAFKLMDELAKHSIDAGIVDLYRVKPINEELLLYHIDQSNRLITLEEHSSIGGIGSAVVEILVDNGITTPVKRFAIGDKNCKRYGDREWTHKQYGLDVDTVVCELIDTLQRASRESMSSTGQNIDFKAHSGDQEIYDLGVHEFAQLFGCSVDGFSDKCKEYIAKSDFRFRKLSWDEKEGVVLESLRHIDSSDFSESGPYRKTIWEKGWSENLTEFVNNSFNLQYLIPKFVRRNTVKRISGEYIIPYSSDFETAFASVMRKVIFGKYFSEAQSIFEFGCGTGLNLVELAEMFPDKKLYGLDWAQASCEIVRKIALSKNFKIEPILFDMYNPDYQVNVTPVDAVCTIGAMEQLGKNFEAFLEFLLKKKPLICINIETMNEMYTNETLCDYVTIEYTKKRKYLFGYLSKLRKLENRGVIIILQEQRIFGGQYHEGYSFVVWKPL